MCVCVYVVDLLWQLLQHRISATTAFLAGRDCREFSVHMCARMVCMCGESCVRIRLDNWFSGFVKRSFECLKRDYQRLIRYCLHCSLCWTNGTERLIF